MGVLDTRERSERCTVGWGSAANGSAGVGPPRRRFGAGNKPRAVSLSEGAVRMSSSRVDERASQLSLSSAPKTDERGHRSDSVGCSARTASSLRNILSMSAMVKDKDKAAL